ncbi:hypothetical protein [Enhygromyxa salina]|nr:hypothetical protein [Enhygromyxa salina]
MRFIVWPDERRRLTQRPPRQRARRRAHERGFAKLIRQTLADKQRRRGE